MMCDKFYLLTATGMLKGIKTETAEDILQLLWPMKSAFPDAVILSVSTYTSGIISTGGEIIFLHEASEKLPEINNVSTAVDITSAS